MASAFRLGFGQYGRIVIIATLFLVAGITGAQQMAPAAPVPPELFAAKKIFISNAGADSGLFPHPFTGSPDRAYNELYAAIRGWGRYTIVSSPSDADLVFELRLTAPYGPTNPNKAEGASDPLPMFRLVVYDRESHYALWTLTESIHWAVFQKSHDENFDESLSALAMDLKAVTQISRASQP